MKYYINLTSGLEWLKSSTFRPDGYLRIQSSHLEAGCWDKVILGLGHGFLLDLALGYPIKVFDGSHDGGSPRAIWQGLPFIEYVLNRRWFDAKPNMVMVKSCNVAKYFSMVYSGLSKEAKSHLDYFKKFLLADSIQLTGQWCQTRDGDYAYFKSILEEDKNGLE